MNTKDLLLEYLVVNDISKGKGILNESLHTSNKKNRLKSSINKIKSSLNRKRTIDDNKKKKIDALTKLKKLAKIVKVNVSQFTIRDDLDVIEKEIQRCEDILNSKHRSDDYKIYLIAAFYIIEHSGKYINIDMEGFTKNQISKIDNYEDLLKEFTETHRESMGFMEKMSIETKILVTILGSSLFFMISKIIKAKTHIDIDNAFATRSKPEGATKMRGPII